MTLNNRLQKASILIITLVCISFSYGQKATNQIKAQIALGVNSPSQSGFVDGFQAKSINFPTVNLGVQYMFKRQFGGKLDFGFNRFSSDDNSISSYAWDLKDGSKANAADFKYTFTDPGTYEVELIVEDENGLTDKETITITVEE